MYSREYLTHMLAYLIGLFIGIGMCLSLNGCAKVTHEIVGEPDVYYHADPIEIIVSSNIPNIPIIVSDNVVIIGGV